jgi:hypothetical protein
MGLRSCILGRDERDLKVTRHVAMRSWLVEAYNELSDVTRIGGGHGPASGCKVSRLLLVLHICDVYVRRNFYTTAMTTITHR